MILGSLIFLGVKMGVKNSSEEWEKFGKKKKAISFKGLLTNLAKSQAEKEINEIDPIEKKKMSAEVSFNLSN